MKTDCIKKFSIECLDRLSVKTFHVEQVHRQGDRLSVKSKQVPLVWEFYSSGAIPHDK